MIKENWDIQFIKPCRSPEERHRMLTPLYTLESLTKGHIVQINLDNCSIQRMEDLTEEATIKDVEAVGLLPLYEIINNGIVVLTCMGVLEMPDWRVKNARAAYERFCRKFWPGHQDDEEATYRPVDPNNKERKVKFSDLSDGARYTYGVAYVSLLQIQNIFHSYPKSTPEKKFELYLHSLIGLLDLVSGFELEIAKWAFWNLDKREINQLIPSIKDRRRDIKENFAKVKNDIQKCREFAFDAAMDLCWLSGANLSEDLGATINIQGTRMKLDNWVGTNDHKLYRICRDIHSTPYNNSTMKRLATAREQELLSHQYWINVDRISKDVSIYRQQSGYSEVDNLLEKIDKAVLYIEMELTKNLNQNFV